MENNLNIISKDNGLCISNPNYFLAFSDFKVSDGIDIIENIDIIKGKYRFEELAELSEDFNEVEASYIAQDFDFEDYFVNSYGDLNIVTIYKNDVVLEDFPEQLKVANSEKGFVDAKIDVSHVIYINKVLSPKLLLKVYKTAIKAKSEFFQGLNLPIHIKNIINTDDFLAILANVPESTFKEENIYEDSVDIVNNEYDDVDLDALLLSIEEAVIISCEDALEKLGLSFGILDYLVSEGILIGDLVEAGLELVEGVEITDELKDKLEKQIFKALTDINVIVLLMAAIRTEDDLSKGRIREIDVSDDPSYLYTDEVLGMAIANQIAGSKAIFNFNRYDNLKPGILYGLRPMVDDIFGGLIAGCMSKIFEE
ncbi:MAG: phosphatidylglycerophosphatase A [archaeon]|nr:phosphatidylglycerophosphatase A [archaeon]